jgi:alpha-L-fucosidase
LPDDKPKSDAELLGTALLCRARNMNLLLDIAPDFHGVVPQEQVHALMRLKQNLDRV